MVTGPNPPPELPHPPDKICPHPHINLHPPVDTLHTVHPLLGLQGGVPQVGGVRRADPVLLAAGRGAALPGPALLHSQQPRSLPSQPNSAAGHKQVCRQNPSLSQVCCSAPAPRLSAGRQSRGWGRARRGRPAVRAGAAASCRTPGVCGPAGVTGNWAGCRGGRAVGRAVGRREVGGKRTRRGRTVNWSSCVWDAAKISSSVLMVAEKLVPAGPSSLDTVNKIRFSLEPV